MKDNRLLSEKFKSLMSNIYKWTSDTWALIWAAVAKAPAYWIDFANEAWKIIYTWYTDWEYKPTNNKIDEYTTKYIDFVNNEAKDNMISPITKEYYEWLATAPDLLVPGTWITKLNKLWKVDDVVDIAKKTDIVGSVKTYADKFAASFKQFLSKDKKIKNLNTELKDLTKKFNKWKKNYTPDEILQIEKWLADKQKVIDGLIAKGKDKIAIDMKKDIKMDKDLQKMINPDSTIKKIAKNTGKAAWIWVAAWTWIALLSDDEETKDDTFPEDEIITSTTWAWNWEGGWGGWGNGGTEWNNKNQTNDTMWEEKKGGTDIAPTDNWETVLDNKEVKDAVNNEMGLTVSKMDDNGVTHKMYREWDKIKVKSPSWQVYILASWVNDSNQTSKFQWAERVKLDF